ncbi:MAG: hypothetical protein GXO39_07720 [Thermotogae bacterium]|nr:hypothetical protein [Thermotogota bacterium]
MKRAFVSVMVLSLVSPVLGQSVVVSHGPYGSAGSLYRFSLSPFSFTDSSTSYGMLVNHVKYVAGHLYSVASQKDYIYIHDTTLTLIDSVETDSGANLWMGEYTSDGRAFVSEYLLNRIVAYDLNSKTQLWSREVDLSPTFVGLKENALFAISSGYDMGSYTAGPSTLYAIDTSDGTLLDSADVGINMLAAAFVGDTIILVGGDYFNPSTYKVYILTYTGALTLIDSVDAPAPLSFAVPIGSDTLVVGGYGYVGLLSLSSLNFTSLNFGSHVGFAGAVAHGDSIFVPAAEDYSTPGNLLLFSRSTLSIITTAPLSVSPSSITLIPASTSVNERKIVTSLPDGLYDVSGRRVHNPKRGRIYFKISDGKVRKVAYR